MTLLGSRKKILLAIITLLILAGGVGAFIASKKNSTDSTKQQNMENGGFPEPITLEDPQLKNSASQINTDQELPKGTLSPHTVASSPTKYFGQEIKLRGLILESSPGQYSVTSQNANEPQGLRLIFNQAKINIKSYANPGYNSKETNKLVNPVTITGKLAVPKNNQPLSFEITSIKE